MPNACRIAATASSSNRSASSCANTPFSHNFTICSCTRSSASCTSRTYEPANTTSGL